MKKLILFLLLVSINTSHSEEYKFFELNADYLKTFTVSDSTYIIETDGQTCLLFNSKDKSYSEIYTGMNEFGKSQDKTGFNTTTIFNNLLFIATNKENRIISLVDNSIIIDSVDKTIFKYSYINDNNLFGVTEFGEIYKIDINPNSHNINYELIEKINEPMVLFTINNKNYIITIKNEILDVNNFETTNKISIYSKPNKVTITEDYINFEFPYYYKRYNKSFQFIDSVRTDRFDYLSSNSGFIIPYYDGGSESVNIDYYDDNRILQNSFSYPLPLNLKMVYINSYFESNGNVYLFSDKKYICEFDKVNEKFNEISFLDLTDRILTGYTDFYSSEIGGICSDQSSFYITKDGGINWKRFTDNVVRKFPNNNYFFQIKFFSPNKFIAFGNSYKGTILSTDFGESFENLYYPSGISYSETYFEELPSKSIFQTYSLLSKIGDIQSFQVFDKNLEHQSDTFLLDTYYRGAANIGNSLKSLSYNYGDHGIIFKICETDTNLKEISFDLLGGNVESVYGIAALKNKYYISIVYNNNDKQYILSSDAFSSDWDTLNVSENKRFYFIYSQNNNLYLIDSTMKLYKYNFDKNIVEIVTQLPIIKKSLLDINIYDNEIYMSYGSTFLKGIRVPIYSVKSSVKSESIPSFYIYPAYPLPTKDIVNVKLDYEQRLDINNIKLELYNLNGSLLNNKLEYGIINNKPYQSILTIDISSYNTGIYFLRVKLGNKVEYVPILKE